MSALQEPAVTSLSFASLGLPQQLLQAVSDSGYETPTPIQQEIIPLLLSGRDVVGQAQTGTGKTAAFALPLLAQMEHASEKRPSLLVLAPTRELAIQVAESFTLYGKHLPGLSVLPIFGGQSYTIQLRQLAKGAQIIVGTPGRVMDHIRRGTLKTEIINTLVLDEADEMLKMGFLEDVTWILEQLPGRRQTALFSATMPKSIREIAKKYLHEPAEVTIRTKTVSAQTVNQRCVITHGATDKQAALCRFIEAENFDGMLVFVRTKIQTMELAEYLAGLGYAAAPLNGDIQQSQRLRTVEQLKSKKIDILVATDVAARGLDVERISHVINYDIPFDTEAYIHRIGRTGRAGRSGDAILFCHGREKSMLKAIEQATRQKIKIVDLPTTAAINEKRVRAFKERITTALQQELGPYRNVVDEYLRETEILPERLAAALAFMAQGNRPLLLEELRPEINAEVKERDSRRGKSREKGERTERKPFMQLPPEEGMERFRIELGNEHGIKPANIVGAIANEAKINSRHIGRITIFESYSTVDLPFGMPDDVLQILRKSRVGSKTLRLTRLAGDDRMIEGDRQEKRSSRAGNTKTTRGKKPKESRNASLPQN